MTCGAFLVFLGLFGFRLPDFPMLKFGLLRLKTFAFCAEELKLFKF